MRRSLAELDYGRDLWMEREIKSVANVTRSDIADFLQIAATASILPEIEEYALTDANRALCELKHQPVRGAKVLCLD